VNTTHYPATGATIVGGQVPDTVGPASISEPTVTHAPPVEGASAAQLREHVTHLESALNDLTTRLGAVTLERDQWKNRAEHLTKAKR
jgi:hypothetical protein